MIPANEDLNFIMVIIIKNGFQVIIIKMVFHENGFASSPRMAPMAPKEEPNGPQIVQWFNVVCFYVVKQAKDFSMGVMWCASMDYQRGGCNT